jgi:hypothetical protein
LLAHNSKETGEISRISLTKIARGIRALDLIATNIPNNLSRSGVISTGLSDHEMVYCVRKANWKKLPAQTKQFRNYAKYNGESFCSDLNNLTGRA